MAEERDFMMDIGYELPSNAPKQVEGESREYYRHPPGTYLGFIGKITAKFKDPSGKRCEADDTGATFSHYILNLWIRKFLGNAQDPVGQQVITDDLKIPDRPISELYFPVVLFNEPTRLWSNKLMFDKWKIPGHDKYSIIQASPNNPANKITNYNGFPAFYGLPCKFSLTFKADSEKQARYIDGGVEILDYNARIPLDKLKEFEVGIETLVEHERAQREAERAASRQGGYVTPTAPQTNFDEYNVPDVPNTLDDFIS